ncbi:uncharacterized protein LOC134824115 [Bolinopsis microptera]|uniref:uncharacterized protein LOC134824115 n=1 Tax=Bolinopsis microptera TaxID=2820187 RepID=UPI003079C9E7
MSDTENITDNEISDVNEGLIASHPDSTEKSLTTISKTAPRFDVADVICKAHWMENKDDENWKTTIFDKQPLQVDITKDTVEDKPTTVAEEKVEEMSSQRFEELEGYFNQTNVTYRRKEAFEKFNSGKIAVEMDDEMKKQFERCVEKETVRSRQRCLIFLTLGGVLITIGLGLVLYTYTIHYHAHTRISGATILNVGLLMEIFTVAGWNGGAI